jgi:hypothetical protein
MHGLLELGVVDRDISYTILLLRGRYARVYWRRGEEDSVAASLELGHQFVQHDI